MQRTEAPGGPEAAHSIPAIHKDGPMTLAPETRLALLSLPPEQITPELRAVVADWAARCDALAAHAKAALDPFTLPIPATLATLSQQPPTFSLGTDTQGGI